MSHTSKAPHAPHIPHTPMYHMYLIHSYTLKCFVNIHNWNMHFTFTTTIENVFPMTRFKHLHFWTFGAYTCKLILSSKRLLCVRIPHLIHCRIGGGGQKGHVPQKSKSLISLLIDRVAHFHFFAAFPVVWRAALVGRDGTESRKRRTRVIALHRCGTSLTSVMTIIIYNILRWVWSVQG